MTTTQQPKPHIDGGTFTTIATAPTTRGWRITITQWTTYRGTTRFEVHRENPQAKLFRLGHFATEAEARAAANREWAADRGAVA